MTDVAIDLEEQLARIQRMQEETRKFVSEQHKLQAEAAKFARDRDLAPWQIAVGGMAAGAALVGATAAFMKIFG
jgi:tRNA nucleotidyltransferase (CCA-adding enzyme)